MNRQVLYLLALAMLLVEFVQLSETHKLVKIRKLYRPKSWSHHKPPWRPFPHESKYHFKKRPSSKPRRRPRWHMHQKHPPYRIPEEQSYTIEIALPKRGDDYSSKSPEPWSNNRKVYGYVPDFSGEYEDQIIGGPKRRMKIRMIKEVKPKLRIKISRDDDLSERELVNVSTLTQVAARQPDKDPVHQIYPRISLNRGLDGG